MLNKTFFCILMMGSIFMALGGCTTKEYPVKHWYKGNLHAHSYWSDGKEFPEIIMDWYKTNGYHFTVLSDHNILSENEKWITLAKQEYLQKGFQNYLKKYGDTWVNHKTDSLGRIMVKLKTYEEYKSLFEDSNFLIIQSEEISSGYLDKPIHINATNIQKTIDPLGGASIVEVLQNNVDAILRQSKEMNIPILPHINHPNFAYSIKAEDFVQLKNVQFFEVYNGHPLVNNEGDSTHIGTEEMWDLINISYFEKQQPLLYGIATDDSHQYLKYDKEQSNPGRGWVMVETDSLQAPNLIEAMKNGNFYASTGVLLKELNFHNNTLKLEVVQELDTDYEIQFIGVTCDVKEAKILKVVKGNKAEFELTDQLVFVRAKVISNKTNKNFFDDTEFEKAWSQPVMYQKE